MSDAKEIVSARIAHTLASGQRESHVAANAAVLAGNLPPLHGQSCVDCGAPAACYEHRDYAKPLDVEPVCRACNAIRGAAQNRPDTEQRLAEFEIEHETHWRSFLSTPVLAPMDQVMACKSYREAVRLAWDLRQFPAMTMATAAERVGIKASHFNTMLKTGDVPHRQDLPAKRINDYEWCVGNRAVTQYLLSKTGILLNQSLLQSLVKAAEGTQG